MDTFWTTLLSILGAITAGLLALATKNPTLSLHLLEDARRVMRYAVLFLGGAIAGSFAAQNGFGWVPNALFGALLYIALLGFVSGHMATRALAVKEVGKNKNQDGNSEG